jgi:hypothetical protein
MGSNPTGGMDVCVCVLCEFILCLPHVEAGKDTSTVIRKKVNEDLSLDKPLRVIYRITAN